MNNLFREFNISPTNGFLPHEEPYARLPRYYQAWEELGWYLPDLMLSDTLIETVRKLPELSTNKLGHHLAYERAMLILSYAAHAYLLEKGDKKLPAKLAVPWFEIAHKLGRPPVLSHASAVLHNWQKIDPQKPIGLNNLMILQRYKGSNDEAWFFLVTVVIEAIGAKIIGSIILLYENRDKPETQWLENIHKGIVSMTETLNKMILKCDPHIFYTQLRPFLASLEGIVFEGVSTKPRTYIGGSAAQSSLIQAIDIVMGIDHNHESHNNFLMQMRDYMPAQHRLFLQYLEGLPKIPEIISEDQKPLCSGITTQLEVFRKAHFKIFQTYVGKQTSKAGPGDRGTGGTDAAKFLKDLLKDTRESD